MPPLAIIYNCNNRSEFHTFHLAQKKKSNSNTFQFPGEYTVVLHSLWASHSAETPKGVN